MNTGPALISLALLAFFAGSARAQTAEARPVIVAAENVYGDIAAQIGGPDAVVRSILSNLDQDPHSFEASPSTARELARASIVLYNGLDYDPWIITLLRASPSADRSVIVVADLVHRRTGANPHLWYDPTVMPVVARSVAAALVAADPAHAPGYARRLQSVADALDALAGRIATLKGRVAGVPVTATEPVFGEMASALGLTMRNERFQLAVMNDTEPRASDIAAFEADLASHRVRLLLFNSQAANPIAQRMVGRARAAGIAVVGVTETLPPGTSYQAWIGAELDAVAASLSAKP